MARRATTLLEKRLIRWRACSVFPILVALKFRDWQNMPVLNINDLANAVRSVLLPGEELPLAIVREGKESGQGVGYLPDGTMVIVENARKHIGETMDIVVTSALQTSAGRLVFAKLRA